MANLLQRELSSCRLTWEKTKDFVGNLKCVCFHSFISRPFMVVIPLLRNKLHHARVLQCSANTISPQTINEKTLQQSFLHGKYQIYGQRITVLQLPISVFLSKFLDISMSCCDIITRTTGKQRIYKILVTATIKMGT